MRELKIAFRRLRQQPWFAAGAIVTLALGIAAPTTLFTLVDATLLKPLAVSPLSGHLRRANDHDGWAVHHRPGRVSEEMRALRQVPPMASSASALTYQRLDDTLLSETASPRQVTSFSVSRRILRAVRPAHGGRPALSSADDYAAPFSSRVILSHRAWRVDVRRQSRRLSAAPFASRAAARWSSAWRRRRSTCRVMRTCGSRSTCVSRSATPTTDTCASSPG